MGSVYNKARSEEVPTDMRSAIDRACTLLGAQSFVVDLDDDSCVDGDANVGSDEGAAVRVWFHRFCVLLEFWMPSVVLPIRGNFLAILSRRVCRLELSDTQIGVFLRRGADFCAALREYRNADPDVVVRLETGMKLSILS